MNKPDSKHGQTSFNLGFISMGLILDSIFLPILLIGSCISGLLVIVFGSKVKKEDPGYSIAKTGKTLGIVAIFLTIFSCF